MPARGRTRFSGHDDTPAGRAGMRTACLWAMLLLPMLVIAEDRQPAKAPVILFWTSQPYALMHVTHMTALPHGDDLPPLLAYLGNKGVIPLAWKAGKSISDEKTAEQIAEYWCSPDFEGSKGIAIDECGGTPQSNAKLAQALRLARKKSPSLYIAVWNAGILRGVLSSAYKGAADLVMLESYFGPGDPWRLRMGLNTLLARTAGISAKTIFALGLNDTDDDVKQGKSRGWANNRDALDEQMAWIRKNAAEMPGIAFFAPHASAELQKVADEMAERLFR
jgi:hypothetical protein